MANAGDLAISLKVNSEGLVEGLKVATKSVDGVAQSFRTSFGGVGSAVKSAAKEHVGFLGVLKEFKAEQVQQARTANFLANEITGIIPASAGASGAMKGLLGAGLELAAGGGAIAVGFELTKVALEHVVAKIDLANERAKAFRAAQFSTMESLRSAYEGLAESFARPITRTAAVARDESRKAQAEIRKLNEEIRALSNDKSAGAWVANLFGYANEAQIKKLSAQVAGTRAGLKAKAPEAASEAAAGERAQQEREASAQILSIHASMSGQVERIRSELAAKLKALDWDAAKYGDQTGAVRVALEKQANEEIRKARADLSRGYRESEFGLLTDILSQKAQIEGAANLKTRARLDEYNAARAAGDKEAMARIKALAIMEQDRARRDLANLATKRGLETNITPELAAYRKQRDESQTAVMAAQAATVENVSARIESLTSGIASGWASSIKGMITGAASFTDSVGSMFSHLADSILTAIAEMTAKWLAFTAISGLVSLITPVGGAGFLSKLLGFADGGTFPGGKPILVGERGPEVILPRASGTVIPNHALGGGGGVSLHFHGDVYDAGGVRALASNPKFVAGWREAARNGRGP